MIFKYAEIEVFVYATEDLEKVLISLENILCTKVEGLKLKVQKLRGHYGNPITKVRVRVNEKTVLQHLVENLRRLSEHDKQLLLSELNRHIDTKGNFYLRLDKQSAFFNELRLSDRDPIWIKAKISSESAIDDIKALLKKCL